MKRDLIKKELEDALDLLDEKAVEEVVEQKFRYNEKAAGHKPARFVRLRPVLIAAAAVLLIAAITVPVIVMLNRAPDPANQPPEETHSSTAAPESTPGAQSTAPSATTDPIESTTAPHTTTPAGTPVTPTPTETPVTPTPTETPVTPTPTETPVTQTPTETPVTPTPTTPTPTDMPTETPVTPTPTETPTTYAPTETPVTATPVDPPATVTVRDLSLSVIPEGGMRAVPGSVSGGGGIGEPPSPEFYTSFHVFTVIAKFVDVLPDEYSSSRLIKAKILRSIYGEELPEEVLISLPDRYVSDALFDYDCFALSLYQITVDGVRLFNSTTSTFESLPAIFLPGRSGNLNYETGVILAFKDGQLDRSLWELPGWAGMLSWAPGRMEFTEFCDNLFIEKFTDKETWEIDFEGLKAYINADVFTLEDVIAALEIKTANFDHRLSYVSADYFENNETLRYVLDSGAYNCSFEPIHSWLYCRRIIDGYATNEFYILDKDGVYNSSGVAFTQEDLRALPDLEELSAQFDPERPLVHVREDWKITSRRASVACWYAKTETGVYGVARMVIDFNYGYHDDFYLLCDSTGAYREVTREELASIVGYSFIADFEYYEQDIMC